MPSSTAYTAVQRGYMQFPEFRFAPLTGQYCTLQKASGTFQFAANPAADGERVHFIPVWYPDGSYQASCYVYDCWTPAGMIAARLDTSRLTISGSLYDDWYVGGEVREVWDKVFICSGVPRRRGGKHSKSTGILPLGGDRVWGGPDRPTPPFPSISGR